jgi:exopolysaccharide biosynthesis protein
MKNQTEEEVSKCEFAFGGFYEILNHKTIYQFEKYKRSRTAVGISHNGRFLYCFATAGIACPTGRNGLNFEECALILQHLGCTQAMEFDGGHSTGLVLNKKNLIRPNLQRKVPALVGFEFSKTE